VEMICLTLAFFLTDYSSHVDGSPRRSKSITSPLFLLSYCLMASWPPIVEVSIANFFCWWEVLAGMLAEVFLFIITRVFWSRLWSIIVIVKTSVIETVFIDNCFSYQFVFSWSCCWSVLIPCVLFCLLLRFHDCSSWIRFGIEVIHIDLWSL